MIPRAALVLGLAGLIPFAWSALTEVSPALLAWTVATVGPRFAGPFMALNYGTIILAFMSGVLWGFATRATGRQAAIGYALSVIPALWAFLFVGAGPVSSAIWLAAGYLLLLALDAMFTERGLAPPWWLRLRIGLTTAVLICLSVTIFG